MLARIFLFLSVALTMARAEAVPLSLFFDAFYVDTDEEALFMRTDLEGLGHEVTVFSGSDNPTWRAVLASSSQIVLPENESNSLIEDLSPTTRVAIANWVAAGGSIVIVGAPFNRALDFLNTVFNFKLTGGSSSDQWELDAVSASGTTFEGGPTPVANRSAVRTVDALLPDHALDIYSSPGGSSVSVFLVPFGIGSVVYIGYDWFEGSDPGGWTEILDRAVRFQSETPPVVNIGGSMRGLAPIAHVCRNVNTGQQIAVAPSSLDWSCTDEGLIVNPGDVVLQYGIGRAP